MYVMRAYLVKKLGSYLKVKKDLDGDRFNEQVNPVNKTIGSEARKHVRSCDD